MENEDKRSLVVLSGAGMSAESGIKTFRDADGLWEGHDVMEVASPMGWKNDMALVLDFYNQRRAQLKEVKPNNGHEIVAALERFYDVTVITQNVDDLHERAGSTNVIHLHGELRKVRSTINENYVLAWEENLEIGELCPQGGQLRPHIVWFGEAVPKMDVAIQMVAKAEIVLIIGTSLQVYPAAGLVGFAPRHAEIIYIDPKPKTNFELENRSRIWTIDKGASRGMQQFWEKYVDQVFI